MTLRFRDTETGRFVGESTYNRSVAHGGERYEPVEIHRPSAAPPEPTEEYPQEFYDFEDLYFGGEEAGEETEY